MANTDMFSKFKQFDAYPKTLEDFRVKTVTGAGGKDKLLRDFLQPSRFWHSECNFSQETYVAAAFGRLILFNSSSETQY